MTGPISAAAELRRGTVVVLMCLLLIVLIFHASVIVWDHAHPDKIDVWCFHDDRDNHNEAYASYHGSASKVLGACDVHR